MSNFLCAPTDVQHVSYLELLPGGCYAGSFGIVAAGCLRRGEVQPTEQPSVLSAAVGCTAVLSLGFLSEGKEGKQEKGERHRSCPNMQWRTTSVCKVWMEHAYCQHGQGSSKARCG